MTREELEGFHCAVEASIAILGGKYKAIIVWWLTESGIMRYSDIKRKIPQATAKMLSQQQPREPPKMTSNSASKSLSVKRRSRRFTWWGEPSGRAARPYGNSTTTLKNRMVGRAVPGEPPSSGTSAHGPSSDSAPFSTARISAPVQRFVFGSHSTFGLPSTSSMDTMRKSFVASVGSSPSA